MSCVPKKIIVGGKLECSRCHEVKPVDLFYKNKRISTGYNSHCKVCDGLMQKDRPKKPPKIGREVTGKPGSPPKAIVDGKQLCSKCDTWKLVKEFTRSIKSKTGYSYRCKDCDHDLYKTYVTIPNNVKRRRKSAKEWTKNPKNHSRVAKYKAESDKRCRERIRRTWQDRIHTDMQFRLSILLRVRLANAVKREITKPNRIQRKGSSAVRDLGCSIPELMIYLESKFKPGMTWDNYGQKGWHIDHIVPLANVDLFDAEQARKVCHFTNLQPLWASENIRKGNR